MNLDEVRVAAALAQAWTTIRDGYVPSACILAASAGIRALDYYDVEAEPIAVDAFAYNRLGYKVRALPVDQWPPSAWAVGAANVSENTGPGYAGHVVIATVHSGIILDLTAAQFARPQKGITITGPIIAHEGDFTKDAHRTNWLDLDGTHVGYRPTLDLTYRKALDWRSGEKVAGPLIRKMREILGSSATAQRTPEEEAAPTVDRA